ncbi:hypothetical protein [Streptomyces coffeae]|uniref:Uncharacterized protein n=1 Tax=Streptomyces coffeae TaxID=621382 RepID=A0ABS1NE64_9ACTN|nr:hypothetical protein [Streptomyces coffeae]MBL1098341.1 hypothetical protein [Streptomyces coffeae]
MGPAKERVGPTIDVILDEYAATHADQLPTVREVSEKLLDDHDATVSYGNSPPLHVQPPAQEPGHVDQPH